MQLKQLVPESFCLSCDVCCRFSEGYTVWSPLFTEEEIKHLVKKNILPPVLFTSSSAAATQDEKMEPLGLKPEVPYHCPSGGILKRPQPIRALKSAVFRPRSIKHEHKAQRINLVAYKDYFICPCFNPEDKKCRIYEDRPFECRLYPFLLVNKDARFYMAQDMKCPYLRNAPQDELDSYINYLQEALQADEARIFLKNSSQLFADYPAADLKLLFPINNNGSL